MLNRKWALVALSALTLGGPAVAQEPAGDEPAPAAAPIEPAACAPKRKGPGLGSLLSAASRAGAGDLLVGRSGPMFGSGKGGSIAGAVLGTALNEAAPQDADGYAGAPAIPGVFGSRKAQVAAVATSTVVGLARSGGADKPAPCAAR